MKKSISLIILSIFMLPVMSQPSGWEVDPGDFQYSMTLTGTFEFSDESLTIDASDYFAAFSGNNCCGIIQPGFDNDLQQWIVFLTIFSNTDGNNVNLKFYDTENDTEIAVYDTIAFKVNSIAGNAETPYVISDEHVENNIALGVRHYKEAVTINLYPCPARDNITISCASEMQKIIIANNHGQVILEKALQTNEYFLSTRKLTPGIYFVLINSKEGDISKRIVIE
jgi:hypothetical protein